MSEELLPKIRKALPIEGGEKHDNEGFQRMGTILASFYGWDGLALLKVLSAALEDSNFHKESAQVDEMIQEVEEDDGEEEEEDDDEDPTPGVVADE